MKKKRQYSRKPMSAAKRLELSQSAHMRAHAHYNPHGKNCNRVKYFYHERVYQRQYEEGRILSKAEKKAIYDRQMEFKRQRDEVNREIAKSGKIPGFVFKEY